MEFLKEAVRFFSTVLLYLLRIFPVKKNRILIAGFGNMFFADNPKYLYLELAKRGGYEFIYCVKKGADISSFPMGVQIVRLHTLRYFYSLATARVWIDCFRKPYYIRKRKSQYYVQTWHGSIGVKKIELDVPEALSDYYRRCGENDTGMIDLMISNSKFCTDLYRRAFAYKGEVLLAGTPKLDLLLTCADAKREHLKITAGLSKNAHVLLYAPTFRADYSLEPYQLDYDRLRCVLTQKFGDDWQILIRLHPNLSKHMEPVHFDYVQDMTNYPDIDELLCFTDILITDYSSTMFEMAIARKPVILYATDVEAYKKDRNFYFPLDSLPFPIAQSNEELERVIEHYNREESLAAADSFLENLGVHETGHASELVADAIEKVVHGETR